MTVRPDFPLHAETHLPQIQFSTVKALMLHEAQEHDLPVVENSDTHLMIQTHYGSLSLSETKGGVSVSTSAAKLDWLFMLKEAVVEHLAHFSPETAAELRWSDTDQAGGLPPNFHFATIQSVRPIGTSFLRVRIKASGLSSFQDDAIHFRIVLPASGLDEVEWPYVAENGSTVWPKGEKALHRPAYTTRWIDHAQGVLDFDVFLHDGGRVTAWAKSVVPGAQVAVAGPGGGGIPETDRILMFADETALPATARILEALPAKAKGHVTIQAIGGANCAYPLSAPAGISVTWLDSEDCTSMADLAIQASNEFPEHFLWFASEKSDTQRVRKVYKERGGNPENAYIAAYWTKE